MSAGSTTPVSLLPHAIAAPSSARPTAGTAGPPRHHHRCARRPTSRPTQSSSSLRAETRFVHSLTSGCTASSATTENAPSDRSPRPRSQPNASPHTPACSNTFESLNSHGASSIANVSPRLSSTIGRNIAPLSENAVGSLSQRHQCAVSCRCQLAAIEWMSSKTNAPNTAQPCARTASPSVARSSSRVRERAA